MIAHTMLKKKMEKFLQQAHERFPRRSLFKIGGIVVGTLGLSRLADRHSEDSLPSEEMVLDQAKERRYEPDSELRTTIFPRKIMWEMAQVLKEKGQWEGGDESDWMSHLDLFESALITLKESGVKGGRLVIAPYEIPKEGDSYNWKSIETAIELMQKHDMAVDLSVGPFNTAYYPGVRLPVDLQEQLKAEFIQNHKYNIHIDMNDDPNMPESSSAIRDFGIHFITKTMEKYGKDKRIDKFYLGNEWPDRQVIEGVEIETGTKEHKQPTHMTVGLDFMEKMIDIIQVGTAKQIALNTNIHPSDLYGLRQKLGSLLQKLGKQGTLGLDIYPTREQEDFYLRTYMNEYDVLIEKMRNTFPETELIFTELQGSPWPDSGLNGLSWAEIYRRDPQLVIEYYRRFFPNTLDTHVLPTHISEVGFWGSEVIVALAMLGYAFPARLFGAIREGMDKNS
jgi:hypothetical protein